MGENRRLRVGGVGGVHAVEKAQIIGMLREIREGLGDLQSAFARAVELEGGGHQGSIADLLAAVFLKLGLVVKGIHLWGTTLHEEKDHPLGAGVEMRRTNREGILVGVITRRGLTAHPHQGHVAETTGGRLQETASREQAVDFRG